MSEYNASSIKVMSPERAAMEFDFARVHQLSVKYPWVASEAISRLIEACRLSGEDMDLAARRHLDGDRSVSTSQGFLDVYRSLIAEERWRGWAPPRPAGGRNQLSNGRD